MPRWSRRSRRAVPRGARRSFHTSVCAGYSTAFPPGPFRPRPRGRTRRRRSARRRSCPRSEPSRGIRLRLRGSASSHTRPRPCTGRRRPRRRRPRDGRRTRPRASRRGPAATAGALSTVLQPPPPAPSPFQTVSCFQAPAGGQAQARAADRDHVRRGGGVVGIAPFGGFFGVPVEVAVVAGSGRDHDAGMVERRRSSSSSAVTPCSEPPQELEISFAPSCSALSSASSRSAVLFEWASTSRILQL